MTAPASPAAEPGLLLGYKGEAGGDVLAFARRWRASSAEPLSVVTVYPGHAPYGFGRVDAEWVAYNREEAERWVGEARTALGEDAGYATLAADSASHGLHDAAEAGGRGTVVVLGSRKSRGLRRTAPGSTADRLMQGSSAPVVLVPWDYETETDRPIARVAVAYVDTEDGRAALRQAVELATRLGATLEVLTVLPDTRVIPALGENRSFAGEQRRAYQDALDAALGSLPADLPAAGRLLEGPVVDALADLSPEHTDLLVCGSRGYGPARRVLLGGVSSRVLRHARVPVAVVPRG